MFVPASHARRCHKPEDLTLSVFCCDRQLSTVHSYKYLGVVVDSKLTWAPHMEHLIRKVSSKIGVLYRSSKKLSNDAKRQYYLSVIQTDLAYGSNAFHSSLPQSAKEHLSRLSKRGVRAIFGVLRPHAQRIGILRHDRSIKPNTQLQIAFFEKNIRSMTRSLVDSQIELAVTTLPPSTLE